ncbi:MAG: hypothetical protein AAB646_00250 [Patescibacteria group bacterium]
MDIPPDLQTEIERRRATSIAYLLLTDDEIIKEIELEKNGPDVHSAAKEAIPDLKFQLQLWTDFYKAVFNLDKDFSKLPMPVPQDDFNKIIVMASEVGIETIFTLLNKKLSNNANKYYFDSSKLRSDRRTGGDYIILIKDPDIVRDVTNNRSAENLQNEGIKVITFEECLILDTFNFWKSGQYTTNGKIFLCAGSRHVDSDGYKVPLMNWESYSGRYNFTFIYFTTRGNYFIRIVIAA